MVLRPKSTEQLELKSPSESAFLGEWTSNGTKTIVSRQEILSEGHHVGLLGAGGDEGGPFYSSRQYCTLRTTDTRIYNTYWGNAGTVMPHQFVGSISPENWPVEAEYRLNTSILADGATAIARVKPTNPTFSSATFLGELREGAPKIIGSELFKGQVARARAAGGEYLNYEFGWKPTVSDARSFFSTVSNFQKEIDTYAGRSGKDNHRKYSFPPITVEEEVDPPIQYWAVGNSIPNLYLQGDITSNEVRMVTKRRTWFSGCFTYYLPPASDLGGSLEWASKANHALGIYITPEVLWNLAPWSWFADWFTNSGDIVSNISSMAVDNLMMRYGYIMEHTVAEIHHRMTGHLPVVSGDSSVSVEVVFGHEYKRRFGASPFGFGTNFDDVSPRQWAIMGALGLSSLPLRPR